MRRDVFAGPTEQLLQRTGGFGQLACRNLAHVVDPDAGEQAVERALPGSGDRARHVFGALFSHPFEAGEPFGGEVVEIGHVAHDAAVDELLDQRLAEVIDVHREAARPVQDGRP